MKLKALWINIFTCNTSGFVSFNSKLCIFFFKLNSRKELYRPQILLEVDETLQLYLACLNKQKSPCRLPSIFYSFRDTNPRRLRRLTITKNTNMNGNLFLLYVPFSDVALVSFLKFQHHTFIFLFLCEFLKFFYRHFTHFLINERSKSPAILFGDQKESSSHSYPDLN